LHSIHVRDVGQGRADGFIRYQFLACTNLAAAPLWVAGAIAFFYERKYRVLGWTFVITLALFFFSKGRGYYLGPVYPMLIAMGAAKAESWLASRTPVQQRAVLSAFFACVVAVGVYACAFIIPFAPSGRLMRFAIDRNGDLREELGWEETVKTVAGIRDSLPVEQRTNVGVLVGNYGEQGAIEILGAKDHLPPPISGTNTAWFRGYPDPPPSTLIVLGLSQKYVDKTFMDCRVAGHTSNSYGAKNEETQDHPDIFVCGRPRLSWPDFWKNFQDFG
jgi:hypothetical protein